MRPRGESCFYLLFFVFFFVHHVHVIQKRRGEESILTFHNKRENDLLTDNRLAAISDVLSTLQFFFNL